MNAVAAKPTVTKSVADLIWVCATLCELLEIENKALTQHDTATVRELADNKTSLSRLYEQTYHALGTDREIKEKITPDELAELQGLGQRLNKLMWSNAIMLKAGIEARQKVMEVFVNAAKKHNENTLHYSKKGHFDALPVARERAALAYNHTL